MINNCYWINVNLAPSLCNIPWCLVFYRTLVLYFLCCDLTNRRLQNDHSAQILDKKYAKYLIWQIAHVRYMWLNPDKLLNSLLDTLHRLKVLFKFTLKDSAFIWTLQYFHDRFLLCENHIISVLINFHYNIIKQTFTKNR